MSVCVSPKRCKKRNLRLLCKSQHRRLVTLPMISDLTPGPASSLAHTDTIFPWISFSLRDRVPNKIWHLSQVKWSKNFPDKLNIWVQSYKRRIESQESLYFFLELEPELFTSKHFIGAWARALWHHLWQQILINFRINTNCYELEMIWQTDRID